MDLNTLLTVCVTIGLAVIGYFVSEGQKRFDNAFHRIEILEAAMKTLPDTYARRDDFKELREALFQKLDRIEDKLDKKADK